MGKKLEVKKGDVYGRLTILKEVEPHVYPSGKTRRKFLVRCSCGSEPFEVLLNSLRIGETTSCGCYVKEKAKETGRANKKYNKYDLTGEYGIGYTTKGEEFLFDLEDYEKIKDYSWSINNRGYVMARVISTKKNVKMHRFLMNCPEDKVVDHISHDTTDNRKSNLRICSQAENCKNLSLAKNNKSGVTGVGWCKASNKWYTQIYVNGKLIHLGYFASKEDAIKARLQAEKEYFGDYAPQKHLYEQYGIA